MKNSLLLLFLTLSISSIMPLGAMKKSSEEMFLKQLTPEIIEFFPNISGPVYFFRLFAQCNRPQEEIKKTHPADALVTSLEKITQLCQEIGIKEEIAALCKEFYRTVKPDIFEDMDLFKSASRQMCPKITLYPDLKDKNHKYSQIFTNFRQLPKNEALARVNECYAATFLRIEQLEADFYLILKNKKASLKQTEALLEEVKQLLALLQKTIPKTPEDLRNKTECGIHLLQLYGGHFIQLLCSMKEGLKNYVHRIEEQKKRCIPVKKSGVLQNPKQLATLQPLAEEATFDDCLDNCIMHSAPAFLTTFYFVGSWLLELDQYSTLHEADQRLLRMFGGLVTYLLSSYMLPPNPEKNYGDTVGKWINTGLLGAAFSYQTYQMIKACA